MKGSWPKVTCSVEAHIIARHALPGIGMAAPHDHDYLIRAGWTHEVNPHKGVTKTMQEMRSYLDKLVTPLAGADLNVALAPFPPTAENLACWIMARLPAYWMFVEIECYEGYKVRVDASSMRAEWARQFGARP